MGLFIYIYLSVYYRCFFSFFFLHFTFYIFLFLFPFPPFFQSVLYWNEIITYIKSNNTRCYKFMGP